ncbi:hypothetical protein [Pseudoscardovia radai]|uniref:hypothetical protein n=1 Tax=Pseudoscardovia radai TaxID=987066 RepID=UPI003992828D
MTTGSDEHDRTLQTADSAAGSPAGPAAGSPAPSDTRRRRLRIAAAVVTALLVLGVVTFRIVASLNSPEKVIKNYMAALASGRYGDAADLSQLTLDDGQRALLTNEVGEQSAQYLTDYSIGEPLSVDGGLAYPITYRLGNGHYTDTITVARQGRDGLVTRWAVDGGLIGTLMVSNPGKDYGTGLSDGYAFSINGASVSPDDTYTVSDGASGGTDAAPSSTPSGDTMSFAAFPGSYTLSVDTGTRWLTWASETESLAGGPTTQGSGASIDTAYFSSEPRISSGLSTYMANLIDDHVASCISSATSYDLASLDYSCPVPEILAMKGDASASVATDGGTTALRTDTGIFRYDSLAQQDKTSATVGLDSDGAGFVVSAASGSLTAAYTTADGKDGATQDGQTQDNQHSTSAVTRYDYAGIPLTISGDDVTLDWKAVDASMSAYAATTAGTAVPLLADGATSLPTYLHCSVEDAASAER